MRRTVETRPNAPLASLLAALLLAACAMPDAAAPGRQGPLTGNWGGQHVALILAGDGGRIEYDCAHGTLDAAVEPDASGAFSVAGRHVRGHGGPVRSDEVPQSAPARYHGAVSSDRMTLQVRTGAATLGPFVLERGAQAQLFKCL